MPEIPQDGQFATFLDDLLTRLHLSNAAAARRLRVAQSQVGRWRRGEGGISKENIRRIHEEFGVDFDYLLGLAGLRTSTPSSTVEAIEAERQLWRSRYDDLMEKKVPRWAREAYIAACEALADAYNQMRPGELSTSDRQALSKATLKSEGEDPDADKDDLALALRSRRRTQQFASVPAGV